MMTEETKDQELNPSADLPMEEPSEQTFVSEEKGIEYPHYEAGAGDKALLESFFEKLKRIASEHASVSVFKKIDELIKEARQEYDALRQQERQAALDAFKASNEGSEEGFEFRADEIGQRIEKSIQFIRQERQEYFQKLEKQKEKVLEGKTRLLAELRELVDKEDINDPAQAQASFKSFKKIQEEWKALGNYMGPQNQELWQSYHALVDRYYSQRHIFFELLELDRKKNFSQKKAIAEQLQVLANKVRAGEALGSLLKEAETLFEEYKHIGPAQKEENEKLWQEVKASLDILFEHKRQVGEAQRLVLEENLKVKKELADLMGLHAQFQSGSINEWNQKSKEVLALQDQWGKLKGGLPRQGGKEVSHAFWANLKVFFKHKSEFFHKIDAERKQNLVGKQALVNEVQALVDAGEMNAESTQKVIDLQKQWKNIGHVPEKQKDQIYQKFKAACDAFFELKRQQNKSGKDLEFEANLEKKLAILADLEAMFSDASLLEALGHKKAEWDSIGFVPKKDVKSLQERFRTTWNKLIDFAQTQPKEQLAAWGFELKGLKDEETSERKASISPDARKKIQQLENEIATLENNLEFFAKSKNAEKLIADIEKQIEKAQKELDQLKK